MANKTVALRIPSTLRGQSLTLVLLQAGSIVNGSGDTVVEGSNGWGTATVTEPAVGWSDVELRVGGVTRAEGGLLFIASDIEGTYQVDDPRVSQPSVTVLPGRDRAIARSSRSQIVVYLGELVTVTRQVVDANDNPVNLAGRSLQFVIQDARGVDVAVVPSNAITISGASSDTYSFAVPAAASARVGTYEYSLNDLGASKALLAEGDWLVRGRAVADA